MTTATSATLTSRVHPNSVPTSARGWRTSAHDIAEPASVTATSDQVATREYRATTSAAPTGSSSRRRVRTTPASTTRPPSHAAPASRCTASPSTITHAGSTVRVCPSTRNVPSSTRPATPARSRVRSPPRSSTRTSTAAPSRASAPIPTDDPSVSDSTRPVVRASRPRPEVSMAWTGTTTTAATAAAIAPRRAQRSPRCRSSSRPPRATTIDHSSAPPSTSAPR